MAENLIALAAFAGTGPPQILGVGALDVYASGASWPSGQKNCHAFSTSGALLAIGLELTPFLIIYDVATWLPVAGPTVSAAVTSLAFSPDNTTLAVTFRVSPGLARYSTSGWAIVPALQFTPTVNINVVRYSPDGTKIAIVYEASSYFRMWNSGVFVTLPSGPAAAARMLAFSTDSTKVVVGSGFGITIYNTSDLSVVPHTLTKQDSFASFSGAAFSPDGTQLVICGDSFLQWSPTSTWAFISAGESAAFARGCIFTPDGLHLIIVSNNQTDSVRKMQVSDKLVVNRFNSTGFSPVGGVALSPLTMPRRMVQGIVTDDIGAVVQRTVRAYDRASGMLMREAQSSSTTGVYALGPFVGQQELQRVVLDDSAGALLNDLVTRVLPVES